MLVDDDEAARIGQAFYAADRRNAAEGRYHHRELERQLVRLFRLAVVVDLGHLHLVGIDLVDLGIDDPFDMALPHLQLEHALGIADTADAEVADIGLSRHEGHRDLVANPTLAQIGIHDHREFVGWPVTARLLARRRPRSDRDFCKTPPTVRSRAWRGRRRRRSNCSFPARVLRSHRRRAPGRWRSPGSRSRGTYHRPARRDCCPA